MRYYSLVVTFILLAISIQAQEIIRFDLNGSEKFKFESDSIGRTRIVMDNNKNNFATGAFSLLNNTSGSNNTAIGVSVLNKNKSGYDNIGIGGTALFSNVDGHDNVAIGAEALNKNITGNDNVAIGDQALFNNISGNRNFASGIAALGLNTTGNDNIAIGYTALLNTTTGSNNIAFGNEALKNNNTSSDNIAMGNSSLKNTTGLSNIGIGGKTLENNTFGGDNIAIGYAALNSNTFGGDNIAIGHNALLNVNDYNNVAIGYEAGNSTTGGGNIFLGTNAGKNETGSNKLYINNNDGNSSSALIYGDFATDDLRLNAEVGIGRASVGFPLTIEAGSDGDIMKFYDDGGTAHWHMKLDANDHLSYTETDIANDRFTLRKGGYAGFNNAYSNVTLTAKAQAGHTKLIRLESSTQAELFNVQTTGAAYLSGTLTQNSDKRLKKDIVQVTSALAGVQKLAGYRYNWIAEDRSPEKQIGVIAQEVQAIYPELVRTDEKGMLSVNYSGLAPILIEAVKEQQTIIDEQENRIAKMEQDKIAADTRMAKMEDALESLLPTNNTASSTVKK